MKEIIAKFCLILIFIISSSCGYKVLDNQGSENFSIREMKTSGDNRINFKIKNSMIINSSESKAQSIIMELYTEKKKEVKEKNIKNQITKYQITLSSYVKLNFSKDNKKEEFNIISTGLPSGKYGISWRGSILEIIPLFPCLPAILSPI